MTQSWVSQHALGGDNAQRILYKAKDVKHPVLRPKQSQGDAQLRMTRHPHVAPHKSMLADDLKLSSDDEDSHNVSHEPALDGHSRSAQRALSHGRRVRHSSSSSSDSNSSGESSTSTLHSHSSGPEAPPDTVSPTRAPDPCSSKEIDHPSATHWQLDKWWSQVRKKSSSGERSRSGNIPGYPPSPNTQRAPSPAKSWDSNQEYSPHQSPISIPHFNYRPTSSPQPSPGYGFCPSPFSNVSPRSSPRHSPIPSPVLTICLSPCGSPRANRCLSPLPRDPPRSPSPTLRSSHRKQHPDIRSQLQQATQGTKSRSWNDQFSNTENKNRNSAGRNEQLPKSRLKSRHTQAQHHIRSKSDTVSSHNHGSSTYLPSSKEFSGSSKARQTSAHCPKSRDTHNTRINFEATHCEGTNKADNSFHSQPTVSKNIHSQSRPPEISTLVPVLKNSKRKPDNKKENTDYVGLEDRPHERKKCSLQENQQSKGGKRESKRLAEEQLRRPWIHNSEEDNEAEGITERRRAREERDHHKRDRQRRHEWHGVRVIPKLTSYRPVQDKQKYKAKKDRTSTTSPCGTPPQSPPSSSTCSSSADSESEYQAPITKVPADSTSQRRVRGRVRDPNHPHTNRPKSAPLTVGVLCEKQPNECRHKLYTLVPFGRGEKSAVSSHRDLGNLVVQIDLCLLKRVPDRAADKTSLQASSAPKDKHREAMRHLYVSDGKRKRKMESSTSGRESKRGVTSSNESSGPANDNHIVTETTHNGSLDDKMPLSPVSDYPEFIKCGSQNKTSEKSKDVKMEVELVNVSRNTKPSSESWSSSGHRGGVILPERQHHAEYYLHEAKRMKHRADAMVDKLGKAVNYVDAALSFMECGKAMEQGPLEAKSPYTMYAETVELIRYAMRLKSHSGPGARQEEKQLAVLCFRCLALLYWQMFRLKKDHALKYSKVLLDFFKNSPQVPAPAPRWNGSGKGSGEHSSPLSPNTKHCSWSSHGANTSSSFINIPHRIHQMAANHLNITNSVLYSYEYWEVADNLAKENTEFFNYLNTLTGPLTLHSSISHAVQYTRQALQWIRISAKLN